MLRYDANINGPIVKKKLGFFLDANYQSQQQTQPVLAYLPSGVPQTDTLSPVTIRRHSKLRQVFLTSTWVDEFFWTTSRPPVSRDESLGPCQWAPRGCGRRRKSKNHEHF